MIQSRGLDLAIPPGASAAQQQALQNLGGYGLQRGVNVNLLELR
jgi:hypothetical protein